MSGEPHWPEDEPVAAPGGEAQAAARARAAVKKSATKSEKSTRNRHLATGAAIGIGSAALVAALLYTRSRKGEDKG